MAETKVIFSDDDIKAIAKVLNNAEVSKFQDHWRIKIANNQERRRLSVEIYPFATLTEKKRGALIVIYTANSHLQLHGCRGFVLSEELGEVTFISNTEGKLSGLVVEREAACSLYANADKELLSGDFTKLGVEVMLSGVALSLAEDLLDKKD